MYLGKTKKRREDTLSKDVNRKQLTGCKGDAAKRSNHVGRTVGSAIAEHVWEQREGGGGKTIVENVVQHVQNTGEPKRSGSC